MKKFYEIVRLKRGQNIDLKDSVLEINLDGLSQDAYLFEDGAFNASIAPDTFFWASGGGSILINNRYLAVMRRSKTAKVNAGKYSLFNGRADNLEELINPARIIRELFEELILFYDEALVYPVYPKHQALIDVVYHNLCSLQRIPKNISAAYFTLSEKRLINQPVSICSQGTKYEYSLCYHVNSKNDINVLSVLCLNDLDIGKLSALDGEFHREGEEIIFHNRDIFLYDILTGQTQPLSDKTEESSIISAQDMTEHLAYIINLIGANSHESLTG